MEPLAMQIVLPKGDPNGIKVVELTGWNGKAAIIPRTEVGNLKDHPEFNTNGLYFLFGEDEDSGDRLVYIGESARCADRLGSHDANKDFWNHAFVFLSPPGRKYLESIAALMARNAARYIVKNDSQPREEDLNEFDKIKNERYFDGIKKILLTFDRPVFQSIQDAIINQKIYYLKADGADAKAQLLSDGSLNVLKGSIARIRETKAFDGWSRVARKKFLDDGTLVKKDDGISYLFTRDVVFKSPSAAGATVTGRGINGWTAWKDDKGHTLDENLRK